MTFRWELLEFWHCAFTSEVHEMEQLHNSEIWIFCDAVQEEFAIPVLEFVTVLTSLNFGVSAQ